MNREERRQYWFALYKDWEASGLNRIKFSEANGLNVKSLCAWIRRFRAETTVIIETIAAPEVPVTRVKANGVSSKPSLTLVKAKVITDHDQPHVKTQAVNVVSPSGWQITCFASSDRALLQWLLGAVP